MRLRVCLLVAVAPRPSVQQLAQVECSVRSLSCYYYFNFSFIYYYYCVAHRPRCAIGLLRASRSVPDAYDGRYDIVKQK